MGPRSTSLVLFITFALVFATVPVAVGTHNSIGYEVNIVQADEVDLATGELTPDIQDAYRQTFHGNLEELDTPFPARKAPLDQRGDRYTDCASAGELSDLSQAEYDRALRDGEACYVGFLDTQWEYILVTSLLLQPQSSSQIIPGVGLYNANPDPEDGFCQEPENRVEPECGGAGHTWFVPGSVKVDMDLLEAPLQGGNGLPATGEALTGTDPGSGYYSLPLVVQPYTYLLGQPHPATVAAGNASQFEAGSGPFGPNPGEGGSPLADLTGACGDRTRDCRLLTPEDVIRYDRNDGNLPAPADGELSSQARVCDFLPQFGFQSATGGDPDDRDATLCGTKGVVVNGFIDETSHGGLGVPGAPPTWLATTPGWLHGFILDPANGLAAGQGLNFLPVNGQDTVADGLFHYVAVNPAVPRAGDALDCVLPNILATGDNAIFPGDPGFYGPYRADAIDADVYTFLTREQQELLTGTYQPITTPLINELLAQADSLDPGQLLEDAELPAEVADQLAEVNDQVVELADRADYLESDDEEAHAQPGPQNQAPFSKTRPAGITCNENDVVEIQDEPTTLDGGLRFNAEPAQTTVSLKDPTLLTDGLPARESETEEGAWMTDVYTFDGVIHGVLDSNGNGAFDDCIAPSGFAQPENDICAWKALWDAYNPNCEDVDGNSCQSLLESRNYDVDEGVGLYFSLRTSGPVAIFSDATTEPNTAAERLAVLGQDDPTAQNCIVGFSTGLVDADGVDRGALVDELCDGVRASGILVIDDAFEDQSAVSSLGSFGAGISWAQLVPTPAASVDATGIGQGDELCVYGLFNVEPDQVTTDTQDNLALEGNNLFQDCDALVSSVP